MAKQLDGVLLKEDFSWFGLVLVLAELGIGPRASHMLGKRSTIEPHSLGWP